MGLQLASENTFNRLTYIALHSYAHARILRCCKNPFSKIISQKQVQVRPQAFIWASGEKICRIGLTKKIGLKLVFKISEGSCQPDIVRKANPQSGSICGETTIEMKL